MSVRAEEARGILGGPEVLGGWELLVILELVDPGCLRCDGGLCLSTMYCDCYQPTHHQRTYTQLT